MNLLPLLIILLLLVALIFERAERKTRGRGTWYADRWLIRLSGFLVGAALVLALTACSKREIPTTAPRPVLLAWVPVSGQSMLPTFPERALVEVEIGVPYDQLKAGDTVIFWDYLRGTGKFTHHRLVARQLGNWISRGDNPATNPTADRPWVTPDNYVARTTGRHTQLLSAP